MNLKSYIVSFKIYHKRNDFEIANFPFQDTPRCPSHEVYISQLIHFARVCSNVDENRNLFLAAKLLRQGYRYHKIVKYNIGLKTSATGHIRTYILWCFNI